MIIDTDGITASPCDPEYDDMAFIYCVDRSGYCLSLCRPLNEPLIEVMVLDQRVHRTSDVTAHLHNDKLVVALSLTAAHKLDGITEYVVPLRASADELHAINESLSVIFSNAGRYINHLNGQ